MAQETALYRHPAALEPLLPQASHAELAELTCEVLRQSGRLAGQLPATVNRRRIAALVREMSSYYSNLIEGHKTLPADIEAALRQDYSANPAKRANQHLARAHVEVEEALQTRLEGEPELSVHSPEFLCWLHREFYLRLPEELRQSESVGGEPFRVEPGAL